MALAPVLVRAPAAAAAGGLRRWPARARGPYRAAVPAALARALQMEPCPRRLPRS